MGHSDRQEVNFRRLVTRCELLAAERNEKDWRFEKFVAALQEQLSNIKKDPSSIKSETLAEYSRKLSFLEGVLKTEKLATSSERALQSGLLTPALWGSENALHSKELYHLTKAKYLMEMQDDLLDRQEKENLRRRGKLYSPIQMSADQDVDSLLKYHHNVQERLADDMVQLARDLKENARVASKIVQEDTKRLDQCNALADTNMSSLKVESERLDQHVAKSCNWWIWIMMILVCVTFIWMILFMRMFPKR